MVIMIAEPISRILDDLQADIERQSGHLTWDDVHQIVLARSLGAAAAVEVWQAAASRFSLVPAGEPASAAGATREPLLTQAEERVLARRVAAARLAEEALRLDALPADLKPVTLGLGKAAFDRLVLANTGLVANAAAEFARRTGHLDRDDLFQEGVLGLIRAIEKFDPDKGYRLSTYATWWIRQHIQRAIESKARTIHLPSNVVRELQQLRKKRVRLLNVLGRPPTGRELAHELGLSEGEVNLLLRVELDAELLEDIPQSAGKRAGKFGVRGSPADEPYRRLEKAELLHLVQEHLKRLDRRARFILAQRFGLEGRSKYTLQELGEKLDLTRERVRQIEAIGLTRLGQGKEGHALATYLEE